MRLAKFTFFVLFTLVANLVSFCVFSEAETLTGEFNGIHIDSQYSHTTLYGLKNEDVEVELLSGEGVEFDSIRFGATVRIEGDYVDDKFLVNDLMLISANSRTVISHTGERKTAVVLIDLNDMVVDRTPTEIADIVFNSPRSLNHSYQTSSFGQLSFPADSDRDGEPDVFGPYEIDFTGTVCEAAGLGGTWNEWKVAANQLVAADGKNLSIYDHVIYMLPPNVNCPWSATAQVNGSISFITSYTEFEGQEIVHEVGHNLGLKHASTDFNYDNTISSSEEYADDSSPMGGFFSGCPEGGCWVQFNAPNKDFMGWYDAYPDEIDFATESGQYQLSSLDAHPDTVSSLQVIKLDSYNHPTSGDELFYVSYRVSEAPLDGMKEVYEDKVHIHRYWKLDPFYNTPLGKNTRLVALLGVGEFFSDPDNDIFVVRLPDSNGNAVVYIDHTAPDYDQDGEADAIDLDDDNDGVDDNLDCTRFDATSWRTTQEYIDSDLDGFRDSEWAGVTPCYGNSLPSGYIHGWTALDNCVGTYNPDQSDVDGDGVGDLCDNDYDPDGDGIYNGEDNCPNISNFNQADADGDGLGNVCDPDMDNDGVPNEDDCAIIDVAFFNDQAYLDSDGDGVRDSDRLQNLSCFGNTAPEGFVLDSDTDDNCVAAYNPDQADSDGDGIGDVCDVIDPEPPAGPPVIEPTPEPEPMVDPQPTPEPTPAPEPIDPVEEFKQQTPEINTEIKARAIKVQCSLENADRFRFVVRGKGVKKYKRNSRKGKLNIRTYSLTTYKVKCIGQMKKGRRKFVKSQKTLVKIKANELAEVRRSR